MATSKSILVIEDDADLRSGLRDLLEGDDYEVLDADNGKTALEILSQLSTDRLPGCILLDFMMPVMDGEAFIQALLQSGRSDWAKLKIVVLTARWGAGGDLPKLPLVSDVVKKPIDLEVLLNVVTQHCGSPGQGI